MSATLKVIIAAGLALVIGIIIGFVTGRVTLERRWSQPYAVITAAQETKAAAADADPTPKAGTRVLAPMPIGRARLALAKMTADDPVVSPGASVGAGEEGMELHVTLVNKGKCKVTNVTGVAYGFDPVGMSAATNKNGEPYVAFTKLEEPIEPGKKGLVSMKLRYSEAATLAVAQVDQAECADGTSWKRQ